MDYRVVNIKEKTEFKLIFIDTFYRQRLHELDIKKQNIILGELDIVNRLLNREPVTSVEYQTVMTRINNTIKNEQSFNTHLRKIRESEDIEDFNNAIKLLKLSGKIN